MFTPLQPIISTARSPTRLAPDPPLACLPASTSALSLPAWTPASIATTPRNSPSAAHALGRTPCIPLALRLARPTWSPSFRLLPIRPLAKGAWGGREGRGATAESRGPARGGELPRGPTSLGLPSLAGVWDSSSPWSGRCFDEWVAPSFSTCVPPEFPFLRFSWVLGCGILLGALLRTLCLPRE